jgi:hypothetical protein
MTQGIGRYEGPGQALESPHLTPDSIMMRKQDLALCSVLVEQVLKMGIDYGTIAGVPGKVLFDCGASQIIAAFGCYPGSRRILDLKNTDGLIAVCLEVPLINRHTQQICATGVGAASTMESKNKYRWVDKPVEWGIDKEAISSLKTKEQDSRILYRIPNPEPGELLNTLLKMASKRAEVDAAESLPGVSSALKVLLHGAKGPRGDQQERDPWKDFWGEATRLGITEDEVHEKLAAALGHPITSVWDWLSEGKTIEQAIAALRPQGRKPAGSVFEAATEPVTERDKAWSAIKGLLGRTNLTPASLVRWWKEKANVEILPSVFVELKPPDNMTDKDLSNFHDTLLQFAEERKKA